MIEVPFNRAPVVGTEERHLARALASGRLAGDGPYTERCRAFFEDHFAAPAALLTSSCTHALELAALVLEIGPGDEVILPSFTFSSSATAFALRGASLVFVDIEPRTMNIDLDAVEAALTDRTRVVVPVHYGGVSCDMRRLRRLADERGFAIVEDAAQAFMATHADRPVGVFGDLAAFSFHATKNYTSGGEGGLLVVNRAEFVGPAEIAREKGTNRRDYLQGVVDKYRWTSLGSSYLPSELQAACLWAQLEARETIHRDRLASWEHYAAALARHADGKRFTLMDPRASAGHNAHLFFCKLASHEERERFIGDLARHGVQAASHYQPLHSSAPGRRFGRFVGADRHTTRESERLVRLPLFFGMTPAQRAHVCATIAEVLATSTRALTGTDR
jgi:dTDP-4-amino-4,6-dideoxygalactose transaminase